MGHATSDDAIVVAAGGPAVPASLRAQLAIGGRLVIPVGPVHDQVLVRITRTAEDAFEEERLERVRFVPLVGEEGMHDAEPSCVQLDWTRRRRLCSIVTALAHLLIGALEACRTLTTIRRLPSAR